MSPCGSNHESTKNSSNFYQTFIRRHALPGIFFEVSPQKRFPFPWNCCPPWVGRKNPKENPQERGAFPTILVKLINIRVSDLYSERGEMRYSQSEAQARISAASIDCHRFQHSHVLGSQPHVISQQVFLHMSGIGGSGQGKHFRMECKSED